MGMVQAYVSVSTALTSDAPATSIVVPPEETVAPTDAPVDVTVTTSTTTATGKPTPSVVQTASAEDLVLDGSLLGLVVLCALGVAIV